MRLLLLALVGLLAPVVAATALSAAPDAVGAGTLHPEGCTSEMHVDLLGRATPDGTWRFLFAATRSSILADCGMFGSYNTAYEGDFSFEDGGCLASYASAADTLCFDDPGAWDGFGTKFTLAYCDGPCMRGFAVLYPPLPDAHPACDGAEENIPDHSTFPWAELRDAVWGACETVRFADEQTRPIRDDL